MRVSAVQFRPTKGDRRASLERLIPLARAAAEGSDLLVLPEMACTGYVWPSREAVLPVAEPADGPTLEALSPVARISGCWLVCGFVEDAGEALYNSALVVNPKGERVFTYRKTLLYEADTTWASPGDSGYRTFETGSGTFGVGICMDLNDDRFTGWAAEAAPRAIAFPTNWLDEGEDVRPYWAWRIDRGTSALVAANAWGPDGDISFSGRSTVLDRRRILAAAPKEGDAIIRATLP